MESLVYWTCSFENGKLKTEIRPLGIQKRIDFVQPHAAQEVPRGRSPLRIKAFDTRYRVKEVIASISNGKKTPLRIPLKQLGQFTWGTTWNTSDLPAKEYKMKVCAKDETDDAWPVRECDFKITARTPASSSASGQLLSLRRLDVPHPNCPATRMACSSGKKARPTRWSFRFKPA